MNDPRRDALLVISWLVGLKDGRPSAAAEQWPMACGCLNSADPRSDQTREAAM